MLKQKLLKGQQIKKESLEYKTHCSPDAFNPDDAFAGINPSNAVVMSTPKTTPSEKTEYKQEAQDANSLIDLSDNLLKGDSFLITPNEHQMPPHNTPNVSSGSLSDVNVSNISSSSSSKKKITPSRIPCLNGKSPLSSDEQKSTPNDAAPIRNSSISETPTSSKTNKITRKRFSLDGSRLQFSDSNHSDETNSTRDIEKGKILKSNSLDAGKCGDVFEPVVERDSAVKLSNGAEQNIVGSQGNIQFTTENKISSSTLKKDTATATSRKDFSGEKVKPVSNLKTQSGINRYSQDKILASATGMKSIDPKAAGAQKGPRALKQQSTTSQLKKPLANCREPLSKMSSRQSLLPPKMRTNSASGPNAKRQSVAASNPGSKTVSKPTIPSKTSNVPSKTPTVPSKTPTVPSKTPTVPSKTPTMKNSTEGKVSAGKTSRRPSIASNHVRRPSLSKPPMKPLLSKPQPNQPAVPKITPANSQSGKRVKTGPSNKENNPPEEQQAGQIKVPEAKSSKLPLESVPPASKANIPTTSGFASKLPAPSRLRPPSVSTDGGIPRPSRLVLPSKVKIPGLH